MCVLGGLWPVTCNLLLVGVVSHRLRSRPDPPEFPRMPPGLHVQSIDAQRGQPKPTSQQHHITEETK